MVVMKMGPRKYQWLGQQLWLSWRQPGLAWHISIGRLDVMLLSKPAPKRRSI
jgi:hypothetical protein